MCPFLFQYRSATSMSTTNRKGHDFESQRAAQYRARICNTKHPAELCNGSEWDDVSQKIWAKFDERRQPQDLYEKRILLWVHLNQQVKVTETLNSNEINSIKANLLEAELNSFFLFSYRAYFHGSACIWWAQRCLDLHWTRLTLICVWFPACPHTWITAPRPYFT